MKLFHRISIAFGLLLLVITGVTAVFIHSLLLDNLIEQQQKDLRKKGEAWVQRIKKAERKIGPQDYEQLDSLLASNNKVEILLTGKRKKIYYSTISPDHIDEWVKGLVISKREGKKGILNIGPDDYIVVSVPFESEEIAKLWLASPIRGLKEIRVELIKKILMIMVFGSVFAYGISILIARSLVNPLSKLQRELKKVQNRQFSEVQLIPATGEIGEVTLNVYYLAQELDHFQQVQKQFFQNASHELKTPLMSIQGYAEGIRDDVFTDESAKQGLDVIVNETSRLKGIVTEMILLAKLESEEGLFHPAEVPLLSLVNQAIERIHPILVKKNITIEMEAGSTSPVVNVDHDKFLQALINIVGNGVRHAKELIQIHIFTEQNHVVLEVIDDGEGISPEVLPTLFHRFVKGKDGETGLGLAISRTIIEKSKGTILAHNVKGGGACFRIQLPFAKASK